MKRNLLTLIAAAATVTSASADLYYLGSEAQESLPLKWTVGLNATWDSNVSPTAVGVGADENAFSLNPYVGLSFVNMTPQSTLDVYARVGGVFYLDSPTALGTDDYFTQFRAGLNYTRRFSERLRFSSRNFIAYELEPDYAYGFATTRQNSEYFYWQTDNSIGYRWTERFATYTGFTLTGLQYDNLPNQDMFTWMVYNQFRYQLSPQSVLTFDIRYAQNNADGLTSDSEYLFFLLGIEHRFSPNTILVARGGVQFYESEAVNGNDGAAPYLELALRSQINDQFSVRAFTRYGVEAYDSTRQVFAAPFNLYDFDERLTLRIGATGEYAISPRFSIFGGVDYIPSTYDEGRLVAGFGPGATGSIDEDLFNAYIGLSVKFNETFYGTLSYNYTDSDSDFPFYTYDRSRINVGLRAEF
ncbi:outer membrane beta-barrel protein [Haloferula sp.]|uniref:outer membrane beta-barrel protein n=1 Tax=Haloferula sp. TaxID=2497595 RepID=UPI003C720FB0